MTNTGYTSDHRKIFFCTAPPVAGLIPETWRKILNDRPSPSSFLNFQPPQFFSRCRSFSYIVACIPALPVTPTSQNFADYLGSQDMRGSATTHRLRLILQRGVCDPRLIPPAMAASPCPVTGTDWTATRGLHPRTPTAGSLRAPFRLTHRPAHDRPTGPLLGGGATPQRGAFGAPLWKTPSSRAVRPCTAPKGRRGRHPLGTPARPGSRGCILPHAARQPFVKPLPVSWLKPPEAP